MATFVVDVAPPAPIKDKEATLDELLKHPELYYQVRLELIIHYCPGLYRG